MTLKKKKNSNSIYLNFKELVKKVANTKIKIYSFFMNKNIFNLNYYLGLKYSN